MNALEANMRAVAIVLQLAKIDPWQEVTFLGRHLSSHICSFCGNYSVEGHADDCLYLLATTLVKEYTEATRV